MSQSFMQDEILAQPDLILNNYAYWKESVSPLISLLDTRKNIILLGRGTSGNACVFASYIFSLVKGRHPLDFRPWICTQEVPFADYSDSIVLAYSQSGESTDIIKSAQWLKQRGALVLSITNPEKETTLKKVSDHNISLLAGEEKAVPATKTFIAQLIVTALLAGMDDYNQIKSISDSMKEFIQSESNISEIVDFMAQKEVIFSLGRGLILPAALDFALKLQETVNLPAFGYSSAEFLHGPIGSVRKSDGVIIFEEVESDSVRKVKNILDNKEITYLTFGAENSSNMPSVDWAKSIFLSFIGQYITLKLAEKKGLNPDKPTGLNKITFT